MLLLLRARSAAVLFFFFFNDTATTEIYTLSLHDALPISRGWAYPGVPQLRFRGCAGTGGPGRPGPRGGTDPRAASPDRKSTRLNSSHLVISYAVFCLKKKKKEYSEVFQREDIRSVVGMSD